MDQSFEKRLQKLPDYFSKLINCDLTDRNNLVGLPIRGIYVFIEKGVPLYGGRTNRMKDRIMEHRRTCSRPIDASFPFLMAKKKAYKKGTNVSRERAKLMNDPDFVRALNKAENDVASMQIKYIEVIDPTDQYVLEVYVAEALDTEFNDFDNH